MELEILINNAVALLESSAVNETAFSERYYALCEYLRTMLQEVKNGTYPSDYSAIPALHYVERNVDDFKLLEAIRDINEWYKSHYRKPGKAAIVREKIVEYLCKECNFSEKRARDTIRKMAKHKDIYLEFADYVMNRDFNGDLVTVEGYNAKTLNKDFPLSVVGAYNYLIYLREDTENALRDLERGLPRK